MRRLAASLVLAVLVAVAFCGCVGEEQTAGPISETRMTLNTICTVTIYDTQDRAILTGALDLCAEYEALFSISEEGSDVWRINNAKGAPVAVATPTAQVISAGLEYGELSGGMFDITIGRLSTLWDFTGQSGVPSDEEIALARGTVDYRQVAIEGNIVQIANPETWIDLGGIAKGYIADRAADFLIENGVKSAIIDLGGNIVAVGQRPDGSPWRIGVTKPFGQRSDLLGVVEIGEASVVSSGIYERQFEENGVFYHHILDPFTGMPATSNVAGATIISEGSMEGDALSTIVLLMGVERPSDSAEPVGGEAIGILARQSGFIGAVIVFKDGETASYGEFEFQQF